VVLQVGNLAKGSNLINQTGDQLGCVCGDCHVAIDEGFLGDSVGLGDSIGSSIRVGIPVDMRDSIQLRSCNFSHCEECYSSLRRTVKKIEKER
jgi:hypothetical protein